MRSSVLFWGPLLLAAAPTVARANEVTTCVKASEQAQSFRDDGKYKKAREQLLVCSRDVCPGLVKKDCVGWLQELDASMPSVVITARDPNGKDLVDVKVTVDGQPFTDKLDGKPLTIDPGKHAFHYQAAGAPPVDEDVVMHAGEKNRPLSVKLGNPPPPPPRPELPETTPPQGDNGAGRHGPPVAAFIIGGVGVLALGSFAFFGLTGKSDVSDLRNGCAPRCDQSEVDKARTKLILADISLGVGVVALGVATYMILANRSAATVTTGALTNVDVAAVPGGGVAHVGGRF
jgi:hypothetical protein